MDDVPTSNMPVCLSEDEGPEDENANSIATQLVRPVHEYPKGGDLWMILEKRNLVRREEEERGGLSDGGTWASPATIYVGLDLRRVDR